MIVIDASKGTMNVSSLIDLLNLQSLRALNQQRASEGKPPVTEDQQVKLFGRFIQTAQSA